LKGIGSLIANLYELGVPLRKASFIKLFFHFIRALKKDFCLLMIKSNKKNQSF